MIPLPAKPASKRLQRALNMTESELAEKLEDMAMQGLLLRQKFDDAPDDPFYFPIPFVVGLYEFSLKTIDGELAALYNEYSDDLVKWCNRIPSKLLRVIPVKSSIIQKKAVWSYDQIDSLIKGRKLISLAPCVCSKEKQLIGKECRAPLERCVAFDWFAEHYIDTGMGRPITEGELRGLLSMAEKKSLVISPSNTRECIGFCLCCDCCCTWLHVIGMDPKPAMQVEASFRAEIDPNRCEACGICGKRCNMNAIKTDPYQVDIDRCIGCGLCVAPCPEKAIRMVETGRVFDMEQTASQLFLKMHMEHLRANSYGHSRLKNSWGLVQVKLTRLLLGGMEALKQRNVIKTKLKKDRFIVRSQIQKNPPPHGL
jgi:Fe-S-cluster-containing hydrogenase component 2